ncbi:MAG TPA: hypothetical protein VKW06_00375 [Candidatus Angelobacter sp.]|nr:hypothetical protein [Candidatus Angelobacter sp.]
MAIGSQPEIVRHRLRLTPTGTAVPVRTVERFFLGSQWSFYELEDGRAFWVSERTGKRLESERNRKEK